MLANTGTRCVHFLFPFLTPQFCKITQRKNKLAGQAARAFDGQKNGLQLTNDSKKIANTGYDNWWYQITPSGPMMIQQRREDSTQQLIGTCRTYVVQSFSVKLYPVLLLRWKHVLFAWQDTISCLVAIGRTSFSTLYLHRMHDLSNIYAPFGCSNGNVTFYYGRFKISS